MVIKNYYENEVKVAKNLLIFYSYFYSKSSFINSFKLPLGGKFFSP